jgi:hypothetical protein
MKHRVYRMEEQAINWGLDWDEAIYCGAIETVKEFDTIEDAIAYFENELGGDSDMYGVE